MSQPGEEQNPESGSPSGPRSSTVSKSKSSTAQQSKKTSLGAPEVSYPTANRTFHNDTLDTEMVYYVGVLQDTLPSMSSHADRLKLVPWIRKLFSPEFQIDRLRKKRNKYLIHLVLVTLTDRVFGVFKDSPKMGGIPAIYQLRSAEPFQEARWEKDRYWDEVLYGIMEEEDVMRCSFHEYCSENEDRGKSHPVVGVLLDEEFKFFLYLARPLMLLMPEPDERSLCALWIMTLAKVRTCSCLTMKAVRNDYMQALLGYVQDIRLAGPFCYEPPDNGRTLQPLRHLLRAMKSCKPKNSITNPSSDDAEAFLSEQPIPESGAFCYIAVTGNAKFPEKVSTIPLSITKYNSYFKV